MGIPPGFNYTDITELQDFSHLRMRWWYFEGGFQQRFKEHYSLEYHLTYQDYNDYQPYLVNTTGSRLGMHFRMNFLF